MSKIQAQIPIKEIIHEVPQTAILQVAELLSYPIDKFDWEAAKNLPVRRSSTLRGNQKDISRKPLEKTQDFNPINRWINWPWWRKQQFK